MTYLTLLEFKDFQSLRDTAISLAPGLNVVVGPSSLGKSAAIRALKALVKNAPAPGLIRNGSKEFTVTALFSDGDCIDLTKGKNKSEFRVNGELFAKAGASSVPGAVEDLWNISDPELNFAGQHDKPFLLDVPASQVAHTLGELTNAAILMEAVQRANKLRTQSVADEKSRTREAEEAREELLTHAGLSARIKAAQAARDAYTAVEQLVSQWQELVALNNAYVELSEEIASLKVVPTEGLQQRLQAAMDAVDVMSGLERLYREYDGCKADWLDAALEINDLDNQITDLQNNIQEMLGDNCPLCQQRIEH